MTTPSPRDRRSFEIAIICALPLEADAVIGLFDKHWEDEEERYGKEQRDLNTYTTGVIGRHNVVVAHMPGMGEVSAAGVAAGLRISFPNIKLALVVGICGGVPYSPHHQQDIYLGDVIISQSLIQYDFGKQYPRVFERKDTLADSLGRPALEIRSILAKLGTEYHRTRMQVSSHDYLKQLQLKSARANYPGVDSDHLFDSSYLHQHRNPKICGTYCREDGTQICADAVQMTCKDLGCERREVIRERSMEALPPFIHIGKMGSGNTVMKSGMHRDEIAKKDGIIAFEMEGAGVWDYFPSLVIKGVCDYADSHKNEQWQRYAAATAAACTKTFLKGWPSRSELMEDKSPLWLVPFEKLPQFVGRDTQLEMLETQFRQSSRPDRLAIVGLGGIGKSRLALELACRTRATRLSCSIFWVKATDALTFENDYRHIGQQLQIQELQDKKTEVKTLVRQHLSHQSAGEWLMILDGADDADIWCKNSNQKTQSPFLAQYLPKSQTGSVLVTTRTRSVAANIAAKNMTELKQLRENEAKEMLRHLLVHPEIVEEAEATTTLFKRLTFLL